MQNRQNSNHVVSLKHLNRLLLSMAAAERPWNSNTEHRPTHRATGPWLNKPNESPNSRASEPRDKSILWFWCPAFMFFCKKVLLRSPKNGDLHFLSVIKGLRAFWCKIRSWAEPGNPHEYCILLFWGRHFLAWSYQTSQDMICKQKVSGSGFVFAYESCSRKVWVLFTIQWQVH